MSLIIVVVAYFVWLSCFLVVCNRVRGPFLRTLIVMLGLILGYSVHMLCVIGYWELEVAFAESNTDLDYVVSSDGASLIVNALFFAPATAVVGAVFGVISGIWGGRSEPAIADVANSLSVDEIAKTEEKRNTTGNPYQPPRNA